MEEDGYPTDLSNIIDGELANLIDSFSDGPDCAVVISYAGLVHGYYSKQPVKTPSNTPKVMYKGDEHNAEKIAKALDEENFFVLEDMKPYKHFEAPYHQGHINLLIAGEMNDVWRQTIANWASGNWYETTEQFILFKEKEKKYMTGS